MTAGDLTLTLDGTRRHLAGGEGLTLIEALRRLQGDGAPPELCGQGACGSCLVLVDGKPVAACLTLAALVGDAPVETACGLSDAVGLAVRDGFASTGADRCSDCTPGMMLAATHALRINPWIDEDEARAALLGQTCRCSGYDLQVRAVMRAARRLQEATTCPAR